MYRISKAVATSAVLVLGFLTTFTPAKSNKPVAKIDAAKGTPVLWRDPGDITSRNLFYGPGGKAHEPRGHVYFRKGRHEWQQRPSSTSSTRTASSGE